MRMPTAVGLACLAFVLLLPSVAHGAYYNYQYSYLEAHAAGRLHDGKTFSLRVHRHLDYYLIDGIEQKYEVRYEVRQGETVVCADDSWHSGANVASTDDTSAFTTDGSTFARFSSTVCGGTEVLWMAREQNSPQHLSVQPYVLNHCGDAGVNYDIERKNNSIASATIGGVGATVGLGNGEASLGVYAGQFSC